MIDLRSEALRPQVRVMQIIIGALAMSVVTFGVIVVAIIVGPSQLKPQSNSMTLMAAAFAILTIGAAFVVPRSIVTAARRKIATGDWQPPAQASAMPKALADLGDEGQLIMVYQTALIIGAAILEGSAFFGLVATIIGKSSLALAVSALCLALLLARFPTIGRLENWLDAQRRAMEADRMK